VVEVFVLLRRYAASSGSSVTDVSGYPIGPERPLDCWRWGRKALQKGRYPSTIQRCVTSQKILITFVFTNQNTRKSINITESLHWQKSQLFRHWLN